MVVSVMRIFMLALTMLSMVLQYLAHFCLGTQSCFLHLWLLQHVLVHGCWSQAQHTCCVCLLGHIILFLCFFIFCFRFIFISLFMCLFLFSLFLCYVSFSSYLYFSFSLYVSFCFCFYLYFSFSVVGSFSFEFAVAFDFVASLYGASAWYVFSMCLTIYKYMDSSLFLFIIYSWYS